MLINFEAPIGAGLRQRIVLPAAILHDKVFVVVGAHQEVLNANWPSWADKMSLKAFEYALQRREIPIDRLIIIEEMRAAQWARLQPWLDQLNNEIWTINRKL